MRKNIIITGIPKTGKSTLISNIVDSYSQKTGFLTKELCDKNGRVGFEMITSNFTKRILAHIDFDKKYSVSKYGIDIENLNFIIKEVSTFSNSDLLYIDEVGQMELFSNKFSHLVDSYLDSNNTSIISLTKVFNDPFIERVLHRNDIIIIEIDNSNRKEKTFLVKELLKKIIKAKNYLNEKERFVVSQNTAIMKSTHNTRNLMKTEGKWSCDCPFFVQFQICSHVLAIEEIA